MKNAVIAGMLLALASVGAAEAAPFSTVSFARGESATVYDVGSVNREEGYARAWIYTFRLQPMDGATLVATYREFSCGLGRTRDLARRFATPTGETLRAVETPDAWQSVEPETERGELLRQVCANKPNRPAGAGLSVFEFQTVVRDALAGHTIKTGSR